MTPEEDWSLHAGRRPPSGNGPTGCPAGQDGSTTGPRLAGWEPAQWAASSPHAALEPGPSVRRDRTHFRRGGTRHTEAEKRRKAPPGGGGAESDSSNTLPENRDQTH